MPSTVAFPERARLHADSAGARTATRDGATRTPSPPAAVPRESEYVPSDRTLAFENPSSAVIPNEATPLDASPTPRTTVQGEWRGTLFVRALGGCRLPLQLLPLLLPLLPLPLLKLLPLLLQPLL